MTRPVLGSLVGEDNQPAIDLAPGLAVVVVITDEGMCQMIGRDGVAPTWTANALRNAAQALDPQLTDKCITAPGDGYCLTCTTDARFPVYHPPTTGGATS